MYSQERIEKLKKECWCDNCDDFVVPRIKRWESSIAIVVDYECPRCHEILDKIPRESNVKR